MGVDNVGYGGLVTKNLEWGDASAYCPHPNYAMFQNIKHQIACIMMQ